MTLPELCGLLKRKIVLIVAFTLLGCFIGIGAGFVLLAETFSSTTSMYIGLTQDIPVMSEDGSSIENYKQYLTDGSTNMVTDVATLAQNQQVITEAAAAVNISNPGDFAITSSVEKTSHVVALTVTGPNKDVQKLANQVPLVLQKQASDILLLDNIQQIDTASEPTLSSTTKKHIVYILIGSGCGLCIALLIIMLQNVINPYIKAAYKIESDFELPVLGDVFSDAAAGRLKVVLAERCRQQDGEVVGIAAVSGPNAESVVSGLNDCRIDEKVQLIELPSFMNAADSISKAVEIKNVALVVRPFATLEKDVALAVDQLRLAGVTILGFIVAD